MKILSRDGSWCEVEGTGHRHRINIDLVPDVTVGDFIIAHADLAIGKINANEAKEINKISNQLKHE